MSTFEGLIDEFPGISVDHFMENNWKSSIYFLSHVHKDHTKGLSDVQFHAHLERRKLTLYSHEVSTTILRKWYPHLAKHFQYLALHVPTTLQTAGGVQFTVTLLLAGHCPGSVMFLFENNRSKVLYTGDFRLNIAEFKKFKGLYTSQGALKQINKIHLDTTFMLKRYEQFPSRDESINTLFTLITEWLDISENHEVNLNPSYYYGAEFIFEQIYETFRMPVHVCPETYNCYKYFPNMDKCVTESYKTRIHANCKGYSERQWRFCDRPKAQIRYIKLSAMIWTDWCDGKQLQTKAGNNFRMCYSTHASLQEIRDVLEFLKPEQVEANVEHKDECDLNETLALIDEYIQGNSPIKASPKRRLGLGDKHNLISPEKERLTKRERGVSSSESDDEEAVTLRAVRLKMQRKQNIKGKRDLGFDLTLYD